jgi:chorismate mutase
VDRAEIDAALAPFRARLDDVDARIVEALAERYRIVQEVAAFKAPRGIAPVQPARAQAVKDQAVEAGRAAGLDPAFVGRVWELLIAHAHALEGAVVRDAGEA